MILFRTLRTLRGLEIINKHVLRTCQHYQYSWCSGITSVEMLEERKQNLLCSELIYRKILGNAYIAFPNISNIPIFSEAFK